MGAGMGFHLFCQLHRLLFCILPIGAGWAVVTELGQNFLFDEGMAKYCCYIEMTKTVNQRQAAKIRQRKPINMY